LRSAFADGTTLIVPGHGDAMSRAAALGQLEEIDVVAGLARQCIEESLPVAEAARRGPYPMEVMTAALTRALQVAGSQPS
ncbi:MAG: hypothetical protein M3N43_06340, partial [Actinomycetota bacterium]|nr:hypothetical protein [Actinomycetota bacterium]